ncbi:MBL fold metallo-hydrolase [Pseudaeromonas paramecii]|uniref:MBL fold metallo-hydrolase n=1 Tax=Pseudaeromonas paramecii TaxID=2138166 RepID=A0ABP8QCS6_9GAMM
MATELTLQVLCNNQAHPGLQAEHGWSCWLDDGQSPLLFDAGAGIGLQSNAARLGVDLQRCQHLLLSHGHWDHSGGLASLPDALLSRVQGHPDCLRPRVSRHVGKPVRQIGMPADLASRLGPLAHWGAEPLRFSDSMGSSGVIARPHTIEDSGGPFFWDEAGEAPDPIPDDQALWLATPAGLVVVLGCCHAGLVNTVQHLLSLTGLPRLAGVIGGLHLLHASQERLAFTRRWLGHWAPDFLCLGHCSGDPVIPYLAAALPTTQVRPIQAGDRYRFALRPCPLPPPSNEPHRP